jgi:hypothetical protein
LGWIIDHCLPRNQTPPKLGNYEPQQGTLPMRTRHALQNGVVLVCALTFGSVGMVQAQTPASVRADARAAMYYDRPSVSPYLQLLNTQPSGLSNYQTLVRPLVEEREARMRQGMSLQRLQRQANQAVFASDGAVAPSRAAQKPRHMYFSHFYPRITARMAPESVTPQR